MTNTEKKEYEMKLQRKKDDKIDYDRKWVREYAMGHQTVEVETWVGEVIKVNEIE